MKSVLFFCLSLVFCLAGCATPEPSYLKHIEPLRSQIICPSESPEVDGVISDKTQKDVANTSLVRTYGSNTPFLVRGRQNLVHSADLSNLICGHVFGHGADPSTSDIALIHAGPDGKIDFSRAYGGPDNERCDAVLSLNNRGYLVAGTGGVEAWARYTKKTKGHLILMRTNDSGEIEWQRNYKLFVQPSSLSTMEQIHGELTSIQQTSDAGYIAVGNIAKREGSAYRDWDILVAKFDSNGAVEWIKSMGRDQRDIANYVIETIDGGYAVLGITYPTGIFKKETFLIKIDNYGHTKWTKTFDGDTEVRGFILVQEPSGEFVIGSWSEHPYRDLYGHLLTLMKMDENGNPIWAKGFDSTVYPENKIFGEQSNQFVEYMGRGKDFRTASYDLLRTHDGGYAMTALKSSLNNVAALRTDAEGNIKWGVEKTVNEGGWGDYRISSDFYGLQIMEYPQGIFTVVGNIRNPEGYFHIFEWRFSDSPLTDSCMKKMQVEAVNIQVDAKDTFFNSRSITAKLLEESDFIPTNIPVQQH